ncbi:uncharacterized protein LOC129795052 isoform X1 [Lutzomyia longipalpis]|uniref:uncharacterized protein LOC129795052 isoform X1 n=1 Tax=Lutzomyia longipalpis TaxID=7200 RepID=UPI002484337F|nr:uncharacterized protein LOC129795052 isoform X1 [Lutzomyia longipalpis]XP_055692049.1 uncharacterized protein LOC129795052 isoform X1 [Lutzomyia longipalpis]
MNSKSGAMFLLLLTAVATYGSAISGMKNIPKENFLITDNLADGEFERRISFDGLIGKQTSISQTTKSLNLWQLTDGHLLLQFIYSGEDKIIDCEYIRQKHHIEEFISKFNGDVAMAQSQNFTNNLHHQYTMPHVTKHEFREFLDNDAIPPSYQMAFEDAEDFENFNDAARKSERYGMRNFTFIELKTQQDIPLDLLPLLNIKDIKEQCTARHRELKRIVGGLDSDDEDIKRNATEHLNRKRRDLSSILMIGNTKWCGKGYIATRYTDMGGFSQADRCCRQHDKFCPHWISGFQTKYGIFNWHVGTLSHCKCDYRFRTCLKMADSADANIVGKIFFNIVQSKCFILKPEKYCKQRSWWGECLKKGIRKRAHLRDNRKF